MSYRIERRDNTTASKHLNKEEMQQAKYGILRRAVSCDMTYLDRRDHYHSIYYNKMVCAPGFGTHSFNLSALPPLFSSRPPRDAWIHWDSQLDQFGVNRRV
jgi:hypothetical protein